MINPFLSHVRLSSPFRRGRCKDKSFLSATQGWFLVFRGGSSTPTRHPRFISILHGFFISEGQRVDRRIEFASIHCDRSDWTQMARTKARFGAEPSPRFTATSPRWPGTPPSRPSARVSATSSSPPTSPPAGWTFRALSS